MGAEDDQTDGQQTGALHHQPRGQPAGAAAHHHRPGHQHGQAGQEDDDEDDDDRDAGGGDDVLVLGLLPGDQAGDLLQSY